MPPTTLTVGVLDDYHCTAGRWADWSRVTDRADVHVLTAHIPPAEVAEVLHPFDALIAIRERTRFDRAVLESLPRLRLLVTTGARNAAIDLDAARALAITVCGTEGSGMDTVEHTWALLLAAARRLDLEIADFRAGGWQTTLGTSLRGKTLGVVGLGRIGGDVAKVGLAFGMRVVAWSQNLTDERCREVGVEHAPSLRALLESSDFVTVHVVLSDRTRGLIGAHELQAMKPSAWLVNTSRGPICDESALLDACRRRQIAGAAVDVFGVEPLPTSHPFRDTPNVIATPHLGYVTDTTFKTWFDEVVEDLEAYLDGAPIRVLNA
jgi:phosphoglycerate dehydrogenase-like enzyme